MALKWKLCVWIEKSQIHTCMTAVIGGGTTLPWSEFERLANSLELLSGSGSSLVYEPQFQLAIDNLRQLSGESPRLLLGLRSSAPPRADLH